MIGEQLPDDFDIAYVRNILREHYGHELDESVVEKVFDKARTTAEILKHGRSQSEGFSRTGFSFPVSDLFVLYDRQLGKPIGSA